MRWKGYKGKILRVDLTKCKVFKEELRRELVHLFLGGRGICSKLLFDLTPMGVDAFAPENVLIVATGPLTGTIAPTAGRYHVSSKSPLTGGLGYGNSGGYFGPELKYAGYDALIVQGRSKKPVYLFISDEEVLLRDAKDIWGKDTFETDRIVREEIGDWEAQAIYIGHAGERMVRFAAIINNYFRAAARTGIGAVMGSKKLKAIVVRGTGSVSIEKQGRFMKAVKEVYHKIYSDPTYPSLSRYGTPFLVDLAYLGGGLATRNNQTGIFEKYESISSHIFKDRYVVKSKGCFACPIHCGKYAAVETGKYKGTCGGGPEYESIVCLGSKTGVGKLDAVIYANKLCNMYGLDTISTGDVIAFAMELRDKKIVMDKDTDEVRLKWGNEEAVIEMIRKIAFREGFGNILAEGSMRAAEKIGGEAKKYALHVKGLEPPAYDVRTAKAFGLSWATATRGADHLAALPNFELLGYPPEKGVEWFGSPKAVDPYSTEGKPYMVVWHENFAAAVDSAIICKYTTFSAYAIKPRDLAEILSAATGMNINEAWIMETGERIFNLEKLFNLREGIGKRDDKLPDRFTKEPLPEGPGKGQVVELDQMLPEYYKLRGWDPETSIPRKEKVNKLGLEDELTLIMNRREKL